MARRDVEFSRCTPVFLVWRLPPKIDLYFHLSEMAAMLHVLEIRSMDELLPLRQDWNRLLSQTPDADYFQTLDWLEAYWQHLSADQQLRVLLILDADEIVGIVPLVLRNETTKIGPVRVLSYPLDDWGSFYGPLGAHRKESLTAAMNYLQSSQREWDAIDLRWVNAEGNPEVWLRDAMQAAGMKTYRRPRSVIPIARLDGDWESYWATRSKSARSNLLRYERKLEKLANEKSEGIEHLRFRPAASEDTQLDLRWDLYDTCERLAAVSWQGSSTTGTTLSHDDVRQYLRGQHQQAVRAGGVDINLLRVNGRDVAFQYNYYFDGQVSNLRHGFDPEFAKLGVGKVLMLKVLRDSCERGDKVYDFLPRHVEAKRRFATEILECHSYFHCPTRLDRTLPLLGKRIFDNWQTNRQLESDAAMSQTKV